MPSSVTFSASTATTKASAQSIYTRPQKKQKMSITQTYFLAHSARGKLSKEAARPDHDLRLLVGHANMLDSLMLDLATAEQEQERWFNSIVNGSQEEEGEKSSRHVETIVEEPEHDWEAEDATSSDDDDDESEDEEKPNTKVTAIEVDSDMSEDDDEESGDLALVRTASRHSPPELSLDTDSDSDDEHMPPSPPTMTIEVLSEKQRQAIATTSYYDVKDNASLSQEESEAFEQEGFYLPSRQQPTIIAAY
ncbi:hypothetical protein G647_08496 [Cladophialophora carrionii CBS 160.54]|uniref:Uncharacterized protein n=1 Tax=Cladophialophora carrionii CBS 160.54 TaxID=1279043 RepID=V9D0Q2_9EURO|nr:uncharacterized protein G647_08496 [Cladophialophora carrionii CBS 160.54]ETI20460.1 hypothetical protein G647_08496 [Cladophialophora carrionii CBS 160.54]